MEFPGVGPHFVWFTLGGNDLLAPLYLACSNGAKNYQEAELCVLSAAIEARRCNGELLQNLYQRFPKVQVVQCGYDFQCAAGNCIPFARWPFCKDNVTCANYLGETWGRELLLQLEDRFG